MVGVLIIGIPLTSLAAETLNCWFPPGWKTKPQKAKMIADQLSQKSGIAIKPRIAKNYPEILKSFSSEEQSLVYVGSFVQAIIHARELGTPLVQNINGKDLYSGILVYPKGQDPVAILKNNPEQIAFTVGASSGESSAKAATEGKASIGVANHAAAAGAVKAGKAKAAVVKNWWWDKNKDKFPMLDVYRIPEISVEKNPDNVLTASKAVSPEMCKKIAAAAVASGDAFDAPKMEPFDISRLQFSLELMEKGKIDPKAYNW
jgi:ABC-type phosphate/phosphonate transport system substrate-binding protein